MDVIVHMSVVPRRPEEGTGALGAQVTGSCGLLGVGTGILQTTLCSPARSL